MQQDYHNNLSRAFPGGKAASKDNEHAKDSFYGIETGNRLVKRFRILLKDGESVSIPYAYLPLIRLLSKKELQLCTHDLTVIIMGRNLDRIEEWLNEEKVLWLRESNTPLDPGDGDVFIRSIKIDSEWLD